MWRLSGFGRNLALRCATIVLLLTVYFPANASMGAQAASPASAPAGDLAAMTLVPADWQTAGLDLVGLDTNLGTGWIDEGRIAADSVAGTHTSQPELGRLLMKTQQLDGQRAYQTVLQQVDAAGSTNVTSWIKTQVAQFSDEQNADQMLSLITTTSDIQDVKPVSDAPQIGNRSAALRDFVQEGGSAPKRLYVAFRVSNIVGVVEVINEIGHGDPDLDVGISLAKRLVGHIQDASAESGPALSGLALHLGDIDYSPRLDGYVRLDHTTIPYAGQTADDAGMTSRNQLYGDSDEVFGLAENLPTTTDATASTTYTLRIIRFADSATASQWITRAPQAAIDSAKRGATAAGDKYQSQRLTPRNQTGDASAVYAYTEQSSSTTWHGYQVYFQVGADTVQLVFEAGYDVPSDIVESLATAQADCLKQGECSASASLPQKLVDRICPIDPEGELGTGPIDGAVTMPGVNAARTGVFPGPAPAGQPRVTWRIAGNALNQAEPMIAGGVAYFPFASSMTLPSPFNPNLSEVVAVDAATGTRKWCVIGEGAPHSALAIAGNLLIVPEGNEVVALDSATGAKRWHFDTAGDESDIAIAHGVLYVGSLDGGLVALNAKSGKALWRFQAPNEGGQPATVYAPAVADGVVYVPAQRAMYAIDAESGKQLWRYIPSEKGSTFSLSPAVAGGIVAIGLGDDLLALDAKSGAVRWRITPKGAVGGAPTIVDGVVYVSTGLKNDMVEDDASLAAFSAKDGSALWTVPVQGFAQAQPAFVGGVVYFASGAAGTDDVAATITAVDAASGKIIWTVSLDGPPSSPIVVGGMIYVGTGYPGTGTGTGHTTKTGAIYAIGGAETSTPVAHRPRSQQSKQP